MALKPYTCADCGTDNTRTAFHVLPSRNDPSAQRTYCKTPDHRPECAWCSQRATRRVEDDAGNWALCCHSDSCKGEIGERRRCTAPDCEVVSSTVHACGDHNDDAWCDGCCPQGESADHTATVEDVDEDDEDDDEDADNKEEADTCPCTRTRCSQQYEVGDDARHIILDDGCLRAARDATRPADVKCGCYDCMVIKLRVTEGRDHKTGALLAPTRGLVVDAGLAAVIAERQRLVGATNKALVETLTFLTRVQAEEASRPRQ